MSEPKDRSLVVLLGGMRIGTLDQDPHGQMSFTYDEGYRHGDGKRHQEPAIDASA